MKEILKTYGDEAAIASKLTGFDCRLDSDIEEFLRVRAIPYEKANKCRTYIIVDGGFIKEENPKILAYISVAISNMKIKPHVSKTMNKRLVGMFQNDEAPCYLIGQLGKNDSHSNEIEGRELVNLAMDIIRIGQRAVGGRFVRVDTKKNDWLIRFYKENNFKEVQNDDESGLIQFVRFFDN